MPIEIRELVIKATVQDLNTHSGQGSSAAASSVHIDAIVAECVEQVMKILKDKQER